MHVVPRGYQTDAVASELLYLRAVLYCLIAIVVVAAGVAVGVREPPRSALDRPVSPPAPDWLRGRLARLGLDWVRVKTGPKLDNTYYPQTRVIGLDSETWESQTARGRLDATNALGRALVHIYQPKLSAITTTCRLAVRPVAVLGLILLITKLYAVGIGALALAALLLVGAVVGAVEASNRGFSVLEAAVDLDIEIVRAIDRERVRRLFMGGWL